VDVLVVKWVLSTVLVLGLGMIASGVAMLAQVLRDFDEGTFSE